MANGYLPGTEHSNDTIIEGIFAVHPAKFADLIGSPSVDRPSIFMAQPGL
ncbi:MAG: hypothetical protein AAGF30_02470 [Pseudomonadota bacterium]